MKLVKYFTVFCDVKEFFIFPDFLKPHLYFGCLNFLDVQINPGFLNTPTFDKKNLNF